IAYSRTRAVFHGITTGFFVVAGFFMIFFSAPRVPGVSEFEVFGAGIAHADAPFDPYAPTADPNADNFQYIDPGCGCGCCCGCGGF
ncbi:MAG: hypothetical protein ACYCZ0_03375, partial [Minisyncoccota bacterium]